jgi:predicted RNA-binding protein with PUA-like domain
MPKYWLVKTEPSEYSFQDLKRDGQTVWNGVANALAMKHLKAMAKGDRVMVYHTGDERQIVGIAEVVRPAYPDLRSEDPRQAVVDLRCVRALKNPVPLSRLKPMRDFADFELVRMGRLSVMPVSEERWEKILAMSQKGAK